MAGVLRVVLELIACLVTFSYSQTASNMFQARKQLTASCRDAVLIEAILAGKVNTKLSVVPENLHQTVGYEKHIMIEVGSTLRSWDRAKWVSTGVVLTLICLTGLMGPGYIWITCAMAVIAGLTQSRSVKQAVVDETATLSRIIFSWIVSDDLGCRSYCLGSETNAVFLGNMFYVSERVIDNQIKKSFEAMSG